MSRTLLGVALLAACTAEKDPSPPDPQYTDGFLAVVEEDFQRGVEVATKRGAPVFLVFTGWV